MENSEQPQGDLPNKVDPALESKPDVPIVDPEVQPAPALVEKPVISSPPKRHRGLVISLPILLVVVLAAAGAYWLLHSHNHPKTTATTQTQTTHTTTTTQPKVDGLQLDTKKNYGNKYASGLLPVGDGKYSTTAAKKGYVYTCSQYAQNFSSSQGGAGTRGPWFTNNNTQYDVNKKAHVLGSVAWQPSFSNTVSGSTRTIATNDLPNHTTGVFPIASTDPAYSYDRNPNSIKGQTLSYALSSNPVYNATPNCMGGEVGVMLTGVALFNAFDAGGRDAGAWEVQDNCGGHPEKEGEYHYHTLSSCIKDISVSTVIGYALDGFPITGPQVGTNNILTTDDLDECHGIVSQVFVNGKATTTYHYVMTQDFPYSASCFRSTAAQPPHVGSAQGTPPARQ